jgi:hypothetical protein
MEVPSVQWGYGQESERMRGGRDCDAVMGSCVGQESEMERAWFGEGERGFDIGEETGDVTGLVTWLDLAMRLDSS